MSGGQAQDAYTISFSVIPLDGCPRCQHVKPVTKLCLGVPVAVAETTNSRIVRSVCPNCRLTWDTSWNRAGDPFDDEFLSHREGVESHPQDGNPFPTGPRHLLDLDPA